MQSRLAVAHGGVLLLLFNLWGCSQDVTLRAVDAATGEPLAGVQVRRYGHNISYFSRGGTEIEDLQPTNEQGLAFATDLRQTYSHKFDFKIEGYLPARAMVGGNEWGTVSIISPWLPPPPGDPPIAWESPVKPVEKPREKIIDVPMHRVPRANDESPAPGAEGVRQ